MSFTYVPTRFMLPDSRHDEKRADCAVVFIEQLKHIKTKEWAGKPFKLLPWQEQIVRDVFGVIKPDGARQFRHCFVEIPKKSGKSELAAAIALYLLCADGELGAEIYSIANDHEQAGIVFNLAMYMAFDHPVLRKYCKFIESRKRIVYTPTRSYYAALSSEVKNKYGLNVHGCIVDELIGQSTRKLYDTMTLGSGGARHQPLNFVITTAGDNKNGVCYTEHTYAMDILHERKFDPTYYPVIFAAPDDADWTDPAVWAAANPSYGITVKEAFYQDFYTKAQYNVDIEAEFRTFYLNQWLNSAKKWLPMQTAAVYACIRVLSEAIASLPLQLYKYNGKGAVVADDHPLYDVLHVDGLLRGDYETRMNGFAQARQNGWMSANEIRGLDRLYPIPEELGGDKYYINGNMVEMGRKTSADDQN